MNRTGATFTFTGATFTFVELSAIGRDSRIELIEPSFEAGVALFETEALAEPQRDRVVVLPEEQRNIASSKAIAGKSKVGCH